MIDLSKYRNVSEEEVKTEKSILILEILKTTHTQIYFAIANELETMSEESIVHDLSACFPKLFRNFEEIIEERLIEALENLDEINAYLEKQKEEETN